MNHHKHFLDEKWGTIISPRSEKEPASKPAGSRVPGWTTHQYLKTASNNLLEMLFHFGLKIHYFSSLKPNPASKHTAAYFCTVQCLQQGPGVRGWGIDCSLSTPKWLHNSVPRHRHPPLLAICFLKSYLWCFNPHLHVPTESVLCSPAFTGQHSPCPCNLQTGGEGRGNGVYGKLQEHSKERGHHWTGNIQIKAKLMILIR